jgi:dTDP-4-amino-4,6-dideoxygalactose transaminase
MEPAYARSGAFVAGSSLDRSEAAQARSIILPLSVQMSDEDIDYVVRTLEKAVLGIRRAA